MKWTLKDGAWSSGVISFSEFPLIQAVEARGALLEWNIDEPERSRPRITITDEDECDWLWELIGEPAHVEFVQSAQNPNMRKAFNVAAQWNLETLLALRKLAHGQWLRDWWPTSAVDGVPKLSDEGLVREMNDVAMQVETIVDGYQFSRTEDTSVSLNRTRDNQAQSDYALVAGTVQECAITGPIFSGTSSPAWQGLPAHVVDATENPVHWHVEAAPNPVLDIQVLLADKQSNGEGLEVRVLRGPEELAHGYLDKRGFASVPLGLTVAEVWLQDWTDVVVQVGVDVNESQEVRNRIRAFAQERLRARDRLSFAEECVALY
ncbi:MULTISPECIES: hypothetical protein [Corynebacterium]|uniref:hypothetical protein n=1 Tax=Corynebacterium TaxID=1716 RepID=UPI0008A4F47A|nr:MULTISPECIES: hypothetical protein [Corynebacterium]OFN74917.1 hypothetical protein HMPREF2526_12335 [Corynebacterium sp. HMSC070E08]OFP32205.1 hypothetical protein HMPREF2993_05895 [Corynebacterium sp. HMSC068G04]PMC71499.1 hypothetical protein CJ201_04675 [Corynebacterium aurimucosum]